MLRQSINSLLEAKRNNKATCSNCGNTSDFRVNVKKNELICKSCHMEIKLEEKVACV